MFLYNITLQRSTGITHAIHGNFSGLLEPPAATNHIIRFRAYLTAQGGHVTPADLCEDGTLCL